MTTDAKDFKTDLVKLRELTGAGMMDCNKALKEAEGDLTKAQELIRKRGLDIAKKKSTREAKEGQVIPYIHAGGKLGGIVEINCETDFVARNDDFQSFARDIAMHIAAVQPLYVRSEDIDEAQLAKEKEMFEEELKGKPDNIKDKILEGKLAKRFEDICLMNQQFVKNDSLTVEEYVNETIAKLGENIIIRRFSRLEVGGSL